MSYSYAPFVVHIASWAPLTAFAASLLVVWRFTKGRFSTAILDQPNSRSLHENPVPRAGGLGLHAGVLVALGLIMPALPTTLWIAFAALVSISLLDDVWGIAPIWRLTVHIGACGLFAASTLVGYWPAAVPIAALLCVWMANLYNFMDGSDGLAGGMTVIGFSFYGAAACLSGHVEFALLNFSIAAAASAFLLFNFHPARIFLGDVGSVPLGFLAAALGMLGWLQQDWNWWYPVLVFAPFIVDASVTLARRLMRLEKIWLPHRDHYYQRLVRMGWGHRKTALMEYAVMIASGTFALLGQTLAVMMQSAILAGISLIYLTFAIVIDSRWRRHERLNPS